MSEARRGGMRALAASLSRVAGPILGREGVGTAQLLAEWPAIVGEELARQCWPLRLTFPRGARRDGTLRLRVLPGAALEIQHREPQLIERINGFFGYRAIGRIAIVQGPLPDGAAKAPPRLRPLAAAERAALDRRLAAIADPELRAALAALGAAIIGKN